MNKNSDIPTPGTARKFKCPTPGPKRSIKVPPYAIQFTQAQVNIFVLTASEYSYLAFTSLVIVVELCTLLFYEVIVLKFR